MLLITLNTHPASPAYPRIEHQTVRLIRFHFRLLQERLGSLYPAANRGSYANRPYRRIRTSCLVRRRGLASASYRRSRRQPTVACSWTTRRPKRPVRPQAKAASSRPPHRSTPSCTVAATLRQPSLVLKIKANHRELRTGRRHRRQSLPVTRRSRTGSEWW